MLACDSSRDSRCLRQAMTCGRATVRSAAGSRSPVKSNKPLHVDLACALCFLVGDVAEPFDLRGNFGEFAELRRSQFLFTNRTRSVTTCPALFKRDNVFYRVSAER